MTEKEDQLSWLQKIALVTVVPLAYLLPIGLIVIIGVEAYHFAGWLCCGTPL